MADVQPFRALRYDAARVDPAAAIAPPYDVISPAEQDALYTRSPYNIVRVEYGEQRPSDDARDNRYTRAAADLAAWRKGGILVEDDNPAIYHYRLEFDWAGTRYTRGHFIGALRLEEWEKGIVKPHEHTLSGPKADRLELLRATAAQVSPVYCLYRPPVTAPPLPSLVMAPLYGFEAGGQHHTVSAITDAAAIEALRERFRASDFYIADGHHRYETALAYRDERLAVARARSDPAERSVLAAMSDAHDPGLLVLPTHRLVHRPPRPEAEQAVRELFDIEDAGPLGDAVDMRALPAADGETRFLALGLLPGRACVLTLRDRARAEALMPAREPAPWKKLDVNVLQFAVLDRVFGIGEDALKAGGAVSYIQDPGEAAAAVRSGAAVAAFLLNATPVDQMLAVSDVNGRMPQKSTYFYPKLPTGLVLRSLS